MTPAEYAVFSRACALEVAGIQTVYVEGKPYYWSLPHSPDWDAPLTVEHVVDSDHITSLRFVQRTQCK